jgi:hypothetical protein
LRKEALLKTNEEASSNLPSGVFYELSGNDAGVVVYCRKNEKTEQAILSWDPAF